MPDAPGVNVDPGGAASAAGATPASSTSAATIDASFLGTAASRSPSTSGARRTHPGHPSGGATRGGAPRDPPGPPRGGTPPGLAPPPANGSPRPLSRGGDDAPRGRRNQEGRRV